MNRILKRGMACLLVCTVLFSGNSGRWNPVKKMQAATKEDIHLQGIDVSHHQKTIDWEQVKAAGIDYAIIRCGYGQDVTLQDDVQWKANADGCTAQEIPFGVYLYSYATTVEAAQGEADHVLRLIEGYDLQYPVYYDIEENKQKDLSAKQLGKIASAFAEKIENAGYQVGIYASYDWFQNYLTDPVFDQWERWVARYNTYCGYSKPYSMWQYSSSGTVAGIDSSIHVDMDYVIGVDVITKVKELSCSNEALELQEGETVALSAEVMPKNAFNKNIIWSSSDINVATVSNQGEVKAVGEGKAKIVAISADDSKITVSINLTVTGAEMPEPTEKATETPKPTTKVTETPKPTEKITATPKPTTKVTETPKPTEKATETPKSTTKVTETPKPTEKATETPKPTTKVTETPKPTEKATETPKPTTKVTETPKPAEKATETPKPTTKVTETPKPTEKVTVTPEPTVTVGTVKGLSYQAVSKSEIKLSWKKVSDADGYVVYRYDKDTKKDVSLTTIKKNQTVNYQIGKINGEKGKALSYGTEYTFKVAAYKTVDGKKYYGKKATIDAITKPDVVKIKKVTRTSSTKAKVQWKNVSRATGYVVYISDSKNGTYQAYKTVIGKNKKTITISKLKKKKTYYVRICAYLKHGDNVWYGNYYENVKIPAK